MPTSPGPLLATLTALWERLRSDVPELPPVRLIISPTSRRKDHGPERWAVDNDGTVTGFVINVDILQAGPDATLTMILHDAAHLLAWRREIADTTMRGAYHNREFLTVADEVGLRWPPHAPRGAGVGYADVELTEEARTRYADGLAALTEAIPLTLPHLELPKTTTGRVDRLTLKCQCDPPRSFRMSQTVAAQGPVICGVCGKEFTS